ncbi:MAG: metallophosphoesterase [Candidatus Aenigmarchaeota archaeon]|nr:metallophosphoesterase [Candidatus Aenigmarchaeota archaeon]
MKFIQNSPALLIEEESILVIGDLHIGIAYKLYKKGVNIPSQLPDIEKRLEKLLKKTKAETLVILGDVKHEVPGINYPEMVELPKFLERLSDKIDVHICRGNHDTHLEKILPEKIRLHPAGGFRINNYFFYHGHEWPSEEFLNCKYIILSHVHPMFEFKDKFGYRVSKPAWLKVKVKKEKFSKRYKVKSLGELEIILIPSFNNLLSGYPINKIQEEMNVISPILRNEIVDFKQSELYLLDGTYLGKLSNL